MANRFLREDSSGLFLREDSGYILREADNSIAQTLPFLSQTASGVRTTNTTRFLREDSTGYLLREDSGYHLREDASTADHSGPISQTLPAVTQSASGTFAPGTSTGTIEQTLPAVIQALSGTFPGFRAGTIEQTLPAIAQTLSGTFTPLIFSGEGYQVLGGYPPFRTTAQHIDYGSHSFQASNFWFGDTEYFSLAGFLRHVSGSGAEAAIIATTSFTTGIYINFDDWNDSSGGNKFYVEVVNSNNLKFEFTSEPKSVHGIDSGDWFALFLSVDYSASGDPTVELWVHKEGDSSATDIFNGFTGTPASGPEDIPVISGMILGNSNRESTSADFDETAWWMDDEFVDWSDPDIRGIYVSDSGAPRYLGTVGQKITGGTPRWWVPDGDFTNNLGTASDGSVIGTKETATTSPTDGSYVTFRQELFGNTLFYIGDIEQTLPTLTQNAQGLFGGDNSFGPIVQTLPTISQTVSGTFLVEFLGTIEQVFGPEPVASVGAKDIEAGTNDESYSNANGFWSDTTDQVSTAFWWKTDTSIADFFGMVGDDVRFWIRGEFWDDSSGGNEIRVVMQNESGTQIYSGLSDDFASHGVEYGDWVAIMFSVDYSQSGDPTIHLYIQPQGGSAVEITDPSPFTQASGPQNIDMDQGDSHVCHEDAAPSASNYDLCFSQFFMTDEFVDWSDSNDRENFVTASGYPASINADGSSITGTQPRYWCPDGDVSNNQGSEGNWTENGTIGDCADDPTSGQAAGPFWLTQSASGTFEPPGKIVQTLPLVTQDMQGIVWTIGSITQTSPFIISTAAGPGMIYDDATASIVSTLKILTQFSNGLYFEGASTGTIDQDLFMLTQSASGTYVDDFQATISQTLPFVTQTITGTYAGRAATIQQTLFPITQEAIAFWQVGISTAQITQALLPVTQSLTGTYSAGLTTAAGTQILAPITQELNGLYFGGNRTASITTAVPFLVSTVIANFSPGNVSGFILQTLELLSQSSSGTYSEGGASGSIVQELPRALQDLDGTYTPGISSGTIEQTLPFITQRLFARPFPTFPPAEDQLIWEPPTDELLWQFEEGEVIYEKLSNEQ